MFQIRIPMLTSRHILAFVILLSLLISIALAVSTWDINFWPTDVWDYYLDAAVSLPRLQHLSQIHEALDAQNVRWLHGKEILILFVSTLQRIMGDTQTLRPFVLLSIVSFFLISVLIYVIISRWWGRVPGLVCYMGWMSSFWPYVYILFAKHHLPGMMFFLLAVFSAQRSRSGPVGHFLYFLSGLYLGMSLFSSPVASLYLPFFAAVFFWNHHKEERGRRLVFQILLNGAAVVLGVACILFYVNWPQVIEHLRGYREYVHISGSFNHFYYNQPYLQRWFKDLDLARNPIRGGWLWVFRYFFVIMPVLFPLYLLGGIGLFWTLITRKKKEERFLLPAVFLLSLIPLIMAETVGVAQYGGNYFPAFLGVLLFLSAVIFVAGRDGYWRWAQTRHPLLIRTLLILLCLVQVGVNGVVYLDDVYPSRMATTFLSRKIKAAGAEKVSTYIFHPHRSPFTEFLSPDVLADLSFSPIRFCVQSPDAPVLVPPFTGDSIYVASISTYYDFDRDMFLNQIHENDLWDEFAIASVKTLASSRIWLYEEEIFSYRKLILGHRLPADGPLTKAWLLDGKKLFAQKDRLVPPPDILRLQKNSLRRIGAGSGFYAYKGFIGHFDESKDLSKIGAFIQKDGNPTDSLRAYVYRVDDKEKMWVPAGEEFISLPLSADRLPTKGKVFPVVFQMSQPIAVKPGKYFIQIIRTGDDDPANHYLIVNRPLAFQ